MSLDQRLDNKMLPSRTEISAARSATGQNDDTEQRRARRTMLDHASTWAMPTALLALIAFASLDYPGFLEAANLRNILAQNAPVAIIAVAMTLVMVGGGFDLSVGSTFGCGSVAFASLYGHVPMALALVLAIGLGAGLGAVNGVLVTLVKVNPFVATLGTTSVYGGAALIVSHSQPIVVANPSFTKIGQGLLLAIPYSIWILAAATLALGFTLANTVYGHKLYAIGGNLEAARLAGLRVNVLRTSTYMLVGGAAALGGAILASRLGVGQGDVGTNIPLQAIAMVVIGGTSLFGGEGSVLRTCIGIGLLAVLGNVADSNGWGSEVQDVVQGSIVVAAVALDAFVRSRRSR